MMASHEKALAKSTAQRRLTRAEGIAWARAWRVRMRPFFDAIYGPSICPTCGGRTNG